MKSLALGFLAASVVISGVAFGSGDSPAVEQQINTLIYGHSDADQDKGLKQLRDEYNKCWTYACFKDKADQIIAKQNTIIELQKSYIIQLKGK